MVAPTKYRSVFTGQEIDQAIANMNGALYSSLISNDFLGGTGRVASAELAKILSDNITAVNTGANIKTQLLSVANTHVLTDDEYSKLTFLIPSRSFRGSYPNAATRNAALVNENIGYTGGELSFLVDDGSGDGLNELSFWDTTSNSWQKTKLTNQGGTTPALVAVAGPLNLFSFRTARYNTMKAMVSVCDAGATQRQVQEALITFVGVDTYISVYNEVGNVTNLFNLTTSIVGGNVNLIVNTLAANLTVTGKIIAML